MKIQSFDDFEIQSVVNKGLPILFPTDTLPALGIKPKFSHKLWELKKKTIR